MPPNIEDVVVVVVNHNAQNENEHNTIVVIRASLVLREEFPVELLVLLRAAPRPRPILIPLIVFY